MEFFLAKWHLSCPEITRINFPSSKFARKTPTRATPWGANTVWSRRSWNETAAATRLPLVVSEESGWPSERKGGQNTELVSIMEQLYAYKAVTQFFCPWKDKDTNINDQHGFTQCSCCQYLNQWNISSECVVALQNHDSPLIKAPR